MDSGTQTSLLTDPMAVFAFLAMVVALIFWASGLERLKKTFEVIPPVIYVYFLPMFATTFGITPSASPAYDWMTRYLLPFALLLLMVSIDLRSILRLNVLIRCLGDVPLHGARIAVSGTQGVAVLAAAVAVDTEFVAHAGIAQGSSRPPWRCRSSVTLLMRAASSVSIPLARA